MGISILVLAVAGMVVGGIAGAIYSFRKPDPNPKGVLARKQSE